MAGYQRKVAYLDYLENGMKIKNAGFVKAEENNGQMRLEMRVKNIPQNFTGEYELNADAGGTIGRISLNRGTGGCCVVWNNGTKVPEGRKKVKANGVYIRLPGRRLLQAVWNEPMEVLVDSRREEASAGTGEEESSAAFIPAGEMETEPAAPVLAKPPVPPVNEASEPQETEKTADRRETEQSGEIGNQQAGEAQERQPDAQSEGEKEMSVYPAWEMAFEPHMQISSAPPPEMNPPVSSAPPETESRDRAEEGEEAVCYGDKWEQLSHMYPLTHPFGDERAYLSIAPKDFVVLRQEYQKMVHNSFLLHGYYNYRHLILGKIKEKGEWCYYLGVPGNFYNREKMVAEMFGFEAFEGEKDPADSGDFGYFMKRVEI